MAPPPGKRPLEDGDEHQAGQTKRIKTEASRFDAASKDKLAENFGDEIGLKAKRQRDQAAVNNSDDDEDDNPDAEKALDSDDDEIVEKEEAEDVGARRLNTHKIKQGKFEGEAESTVQEEDGQQFTAFNLNEEKEEGRFDKYGNYERVYEKEQTHDAWADSVEWSKDEIKKNALKNIQKKEALEAEQENTNFDGVAALRALVGYMRPKETVLNALRRLGASAAPVAGWKAKKLKKKATKEGASTSVAEPENSTKSKKDFASLTACADNLLRSGHVTVYDDSYEKLKVLLNAKEEEAGRDRDDTVKWEYRIENKPESKLYGPFSSQQMFDWQKTGVLKQCWCRRILANSDRSAFYDSRRVDFEDWI